MCWVLIEDAQETHGRRGCKSLEGRLDEIQSRGRTPRGCVVAQTLGVCLRLTRRRKALESRNIHIYI